MSEERKKALQSLKTAKGQIEGIIKMIEDDRYCKSIDGSSIFNKKSRFNDFTRSHASLCKRSLQ
ncbi:hypothetical protein CBU02nite_23050 [Clostridium butyricum]|uniref:Uncharacterized protein n=1 Tax=Clostridium butyricum TaxID=1492 RepID=A0A512TNF8_CLOBU|nr:hypothetical protein [Clostridium butyricum]GEQ21799.1 hypothetical protein CBU02nite_23050 [Clostridium butyricum]